MVPDSDVGLGIEFHGQRHYALQSNATIGGLHPQLVFFANRLQDWITLISSQYHEPTSLAAIHINSVLKQML